MASVRMVDEMSFLGDSMFGVAPRLIRIFPPDQSSSPFPCLTEAVPDLSLTMPDLPKWFYDLAGEVVGLMSLPPDWDSYGGNPLDLAVAEAALNTIVRILKPGLPRPVVFPESAGGVGFEFQTPSAELSLIVHGPNEVSFHYEHLAQGYEQEGDGLPDCWDGLSSED